MTRLAGSTVLVTGAARGIGRQLAIWLALQDARLVLWDLDEVALGDAADYLRSALGARVVSHCCDVADRDAVAATAEQVVAELGGIDVLVNCAGVRDDRPLLQQSPDGIERSFAVNSLALFWTTRAFLPGMVQRRRGHVVTVASAAGLIGAAGLTGYCASKWAAVGFDEALRMELRDTAPSVKTTVVCTFFVRGPGRAPGQSRFPRVLPTVRETDVARRVVRAIERDEARVVLPAFVRLAPALHSLPARAFDALAAWLGVLDPLGTRTAPGTPGAEPQPAATSAR